MKAVRIIILVLAIFAVLFGTFVFWPSNGGDLTAVMDDQSIKQDGTQSWVIGTVTNENNKPAFNVVWTIDVIAPDGTVIGQTEMKKFVLWPGQEYDYEVIIDHDNGTSEEADFEIGVEGYLLN